MQSATLKVRNFIEKTLINNLAFFDTMEREWHTLDTYRINKFFTLFRKFFEESIRYLIQHKLEDSLTNEFINLLSEGPFHPTNGSLGIKFHCISLYLDEIYRVTSNSLSFEQLNRFIKPLYKLMAYSLDDRVLNHIKEDVFDVLLESCASENSKKEEEIDNDEEDDDWKQRNPQIDVKKFQVDPLMIVDNLFEFAKLT